MWNVNNNMVVTVPVRQGNTKRNTITHDFRPTDRVVECSNKYENWTEGREYLYFINVYSSLLCYLTATTSRKNCKE
jgi:hypothetical protein